MMQLKQSNLRHPKRTMLKLLCCIIFLFSSRHAVMALSITNNNISSNGTNKRKSTHTSASSPTKDWDLYKLQQKYNRSGGMLYKQSVLRPHEYNTILNELQVLNLRMEDENESSFATKRVGARISKSSEIYTVLSCKEGSLCRLVNSLACENDNDDRRMILAPDIPVEIRVYEKAGAGMEWHIDDILYQPEQIEVVLSLENTSDCLTMWKPHDDPIHTNNSPSDESNTQLKPKYNIQSAQTTPNSALILKAGSVEHKVSPLTNGRRTILKMAFVREDAVLNENMEGHVSHHNKAKKKKNVKQGKSGKGGNASAKRR